MARIVTDNQTYVKAVNLIGNRDTAELDLEVLEELCGEADIAEKVVESCKNSMGQEISDFDIQCLHELTEKTLRMFAFRTEIQGYMKDRMEIVSPNLTELIG